MRKPDLHVRWEAAANKGKPTVWMPANGFSPYADDRPSATQFSEGIEPVRDDEQQITQAIARAFERCCQRGSQESYRTRSTRWHQIGRAQQQQLEIIDLIGRQAEAMNVRAKILDDDFERHTEYARAIDQLMQGQMKIAEFTDGLATQYGRLFKALSNRLELWKRRRSVRVITRSRRRRLSTEKCETLERRLVIRENQGVVTFVERDGFQQVGMLTQ